MSPLINTIVNSASNIVEVPAMIAAALVAFAAPPAAEGRKSKKAWPDRQAYDEGHRHRARLDNLDEVGRTGSLCCSMVIHPRSTPTSSRSRMHPAPAEREAELSAGNAGFKSRKSMQLKHV